MNFTNSIFRILVQLLFFISVANLSSLFVKVFVSRLALGFMKVRGLRTQRGRVVQGSFIAFGRGLTVLRIRIGLIGRRLVLKAFFLFRLFVFLRCLDGDGLELLIDIFLTRVRQDLHFMVVFVFLFLVWSHLFKFF